MTPNKLKYDSTIALKQSYIYKFNFDIFRLLRIPINL
jgi:hypothetical protein